MTGQNTIENLVYGAPFDPIKVVRTPAPVKIVKIVPVVQPNYFISSREKFSNLGSYLPRKGYDGTHHIN